MLLVAALDRIRSARQVDDCRSCETLRRTTMHATSSVGQPSWWAESRISLLFSWSFSRKLSRITLVYQSSYKSPALAILIRWHCRIPDIFRLSLRCYRYLYRQTRRVSEKARAGVWPIRTWWCTRDSPPPGIVWGATAHQLVVCYKSGPYSLICGRRFRGHQ